MTTIEAISTFKGKTIVNVTANVNKNIIDAITIQSFTIYFDDGSEFEFYSNIVHHGNNEYPAVSEIIVEKI